MTRQENANAFSRHLKTHSVMVDSQLDNVMFDVSIKSLSQSQLIVN